MKHPNKYNILAIDDEPKILEIISQMLEYHNDKIRIFHATNKDEALIQATSHIIDLIICDYNLIGHTAIDVLDIFQQNNINLPCIIFSGNLKSTIQSTLNIYDFNVVEIISKSDFNRLLEKINCFTHSSPYQGLQDV